MIQTISQITGTGKFYDYQAAQHQTPPFATLNLIYGPNGSGKTTLAQIFRSLKGDDALLLQKRSFDKKQAQTVELTANMPTPTLFQFKAEKWNAYFPHLEIFDVHYINDNIHAGLEIQTSHKKRLFDIILGEGGIQLKNDIQHIKLRIRNGNKIVRETVQTLERLIDHAFTAQEYATLQPDATIVDRITKKQKDLETAQNFQQILDQSALWKLPELALPYDLEQIKTLLQTSVDSISDTYLEKVKAHKTHLNMSGHSEEWLKQGFEAIQDETCPFCCQKMDSELAILQAYQQYFNTTYNTLLADLQLALKALSDFNMEVVLLDVKRKIITNQTLITFWKNHLPNPPELHELDTEQTALSDAFAALKTALAQKVNNPINAQETTVLDEMKAFLQQFQAKINDFNEKILSFNVAISLLKTSYAPDLAQLELELKQLYALQKRDEPAVIEHCNNLVLYQNGLKKLDQQKKQKQAALNTFKDSIFKNYLNKINSYLQSFAPYLEIRDLTSSYMGSSTEPSVKFALRVHGNVVTQKEHATKISMKYALSEGDKSALALSFFLAKMDLETNLGEKIIVFDDPVSSFDHQRLNTLLDTLMNLAQRAKQVFFLTHNRNLARECWTKMEQSEQSAARYQIKFVGDSSCLIAF